ncbi:integrin beta-1-B-like [Diadema setosum]|uniref:integrin beta-1-B-like n=1 Tax=Diadema setosum TaxID=31175 RepID=UPI003B3A3F96
MAIHVTSQLNRLRWLFLAELFFLSLCTDAQTTGSALCTKAKTCGDCITQNPSCAWCGQPDFQDNENVARCDNPQVLRERGCQENYIENPLSSVDIIDDKPLSKAGDPLEDLVQVYPQSINVAMRPGETIPINLQIRQAEDFPVDLYYLMDLSDSMNDDLVELRRLGPVLVAEMSNITRDFRLGFGAFIDKTVMPYIDIHPKKVKNPCLNKECGPAFSFHNFLPLTLETREFSEEVSKVNSSGNLDSPEGGMDAMMQATVCTQEIGWRDRARHLLLYTTDASFHIAGDGKLGGIVTPNDGKCHMRDGMYTMADEQDYPSISRLSAAMQERSILPIFAIGKAGPTKQDPYVFYEDLPQYFSEAVTARLSADSSNIVKLVKDIYRNITSAVKVEDNSTSVFNLEYTAMCVDGGVYKGVSECSGLKLGDNVTFMVDVTMNEEACNSDKDEFIFKIEPPSLGEQLTVRVKPICSCDCANETARGPEYCSNFGTYVCGACVCDQGRSGRNCECDRAEAEGLDPSCVFTNSSSEECSGRGTCVCGQCECDSRDNPTESIFGAYCHCDNYRCRSYNGKICGGPDRGVCKCDLDTGKNYCDCLEGYEGPACECPISNDTCRAPNGEICNGVGECVCGECQCSDDKYSGATCQICPDCPGECEINQPCVQCRAFHNGAYNKSQCKKCPHPIYIVKELRRSDGHTECRYTDDNGCTVIFTYEILPNGTYYLEVQEYPICPSAAGMLWVILGIIIGIILVGLALLLIWRLLTYIHDRREFQQFEKERANPTWEAGENPIYKSSTSRFQNPTYKMN